MMQRQRQPGWTKNFICEHNDNIFCIYFLASDIKLLQPPVPPPLPSASIPLLKPSVIQLGNKDALTAEEKNSANKQEVNPYRKSPNGIN